MTLSNFKTYVKQTFKRTDKDTEIVQAYNDMILWVAVQMPHGAYKYQSYVYTVTGINNYPLPSTVMHLLHPVRILDGTATGDSARPLNHVTKEVYDLMEDNPNRTSPQTGKPTSYCIYSGAILPTPIPDLSTYLFEIDWTKRPTAQSGDSDTASLGSEWDEVLRNGTLERLYAGIGMYDESQFWANTYKDGRGDPINMCQKLFEMERSREGISPRIGSVRNNNL